MPVFTIIILVVSLYKKVDSYSAFIKGVKEGIGLFHDVFSSMLAMMFAINLMRESGLLDLLSKVFSNILNLNTSIWTMILFRPFSGSASTAVMIDIFKTLGVDSFEGIMASIIQGSTDTTLYVITLYFGTIGVKKIKNSMFIGLISDIVGISIAVVLTFLFFS